MKISKEEFFSEASNTGVPSDKIEAIWSALEQRQKEKSQGFRFAELIYYFGALIVIAGMGWFLISNLELLSGFYLFLIAVIYGCCFLAAGQFLNKREVLQIPSGLFYTLAVCMVPLAIYGLELHFGTWLGVHSWYDKKYVLSEYENRSLMEIGTIIAGLVAIRFIQFPFLMAPIFLALWLLSLDIGPAFFGSDYSWSENARITLWFGVLMLIFSYWLDLRATKDYAFWGYLFGLIAFNTSLLSLISTEWDWMVFTLINVIFLFLAILLDRRVFMVFGGLGVFVYLFHLAEEVFRNSIWFPFVVSLIGILLIVLGIFYQRHEASIRRKIFSLMPEGISSLLPKRKK